MKKFLFAICSICIAASAVAAPLSALAAEEPTEPNYPEIFDDTLTFENLTDFAIASDKNMIFADGHIIVYLEGEDTTVYEFEYTVTHVDYDAENGNFYYSLNDSAASYILPDSPLDLPGEQANHDFSAPKITQTARDLGNGFIYYYDKDDLLIAVDKETRDTQPLNLSGAKIYGDKLYGILANNFLYEITGQDAKQVNITYSNYDKLKYISVGDIPEKLNTYEGLGENAKYVYINEGAWVTAIDLNLLAPASGSTPQYFPISQPREKTYNDVSGTALLLCDSGTVRIVAQGRQVYIMNIAGATALADVEKTALVEGTTATVIVAGEYAHAYPFMSNATRTFALAANEVLTVLYEVSDEALAHKFYIVENAKGERGYVVDEFLGDFNVPVPDESGTSTIPDPDPHTDSHIKTVVLVIVVVVLVLIAVSYLTWIGTRKQKKSAEGAEGEINLREDENNNNDKVE